MNVVEIVVSAKNLTAAGFGAARADSVGLMEGIQKVGILGGAALAAVGIEAVKMGSSFQAEMTKINTQAGVSKSQLGQLGDGVLKLAGQVGVDPNSLAESLYHVESNFSSVGITAPKALDLVRIAAEGAKVGNANLVDVTNALTGAVAANIPGVQNMNQAMGYLNATVGSGDMSMQDLANAMGTGMVAVVKGFGLSMRDVGAALAVFGDNNIRGATAGNQLRIAVQALASPAKAGQKELAALGLSSDQLAKDMQHGGLNEAITDLKTHLDAAGISANEQGQILTEVFGKKAGTGINLLVGQFDRLQGKYVELDKGANTFGTSWQTTSQTTKQQLDQLDASFKALMVSIGEKLLPVVNTMVQFFATHTEVLKILGIVVGVFLVGAFTAWAVSVIAATWPIILIIAAVAALVVGLYELWKHWDTVWGALKTAASDFGHWMWDFFVQWLFHDGLQVGFDAVKMAILTAISALRTAFNDFVQWMWDFFVQWLFHDGLEVGFNAVKDAILTALGAIKTAATTFAQWMWDFFVQWLFRDGIEKGFDAVRDALITAFNAVKTAFGIIGAAIALAWNTVVTAIKTAWDLLWSGAKTTFTTFNSAITTAWNAVVGFFRSALSTIAGFFTGLWSSIVGGVNGAIGAVEGAIRGMVGYISGAVEAAKRAINSIPVVGGVAKFLGFAAGGVVGAVAHAAEGGARGGFVQINEQGGEIVSLPNGSMVRTASDSARLQGQGGGGGPALVVLEIRSSGTAADDAIAELIRHYVRVKGGNVQVALGQN